MATQLSFTLSNPELLTWELWAGMISQDLASSYNLPNPGEEGSWQLWAAELLNIPELEQLGLPDPRGFGLDWRRWAAAFTLATT